jgi:twitching motility protein PilT
MERRISDPTSSADDVREKRSGARRRAPALPDFEVATPSFVAGDIIDDLLDTAVRADASDVHLRSGIPPVLRVHGELRRLDDRPALSSDAIMAIIAATIPGQHRDAFAATGDADYAYEWHSDYRFRVNAFRDQDGCGAVFRLVATHIVTAEELGLSQDIRDLCSLRRGLVLVTGPTGSGKSTTLCALVDLINRTRRDHVVTIEDPIEFVHRHKSCIITQREIGIHTRSFKTALRAALREDPDVVLIGEMRDLETVAIALETAETGHLVFATLHTSTAASTIDRIIDQFPGEQQEQIRVMVAGSLRAVISQALCRRKTGGRVAAREVLFNTPAVANLIRERKLFQVQTIIQTSRRMGMVTLSESLADLVVAGTIDVPEALTHAADKAAFLQTLRTKGIHFDDPTQRGAA